MTSQPVTEDKALPTNWMNCGTSSSIDNLHNFSYRQTTEDTYQIRSKTHVITVDTEGYNIFMKEKSTIGDSAEWNRYLKDHNVVSVPRDDI